MTKICLTRIGAKIGSYLSRHLLLKVLLRAIIVSITILLVGGLSAIILWKLPEIQVDNLSQQGKIELLEKAKLINEYRATLAQAIGGFGLLVTLYFGWRRITAQDRQLVIAQEQQITERFMRAIDQLGSDKLPVKLGGIYALERISKDSDRDYMSILEVLTSYVREFSPRDDNKESERRPNHRLPAEIQAIMNVLGRRFFPKSTMSFSAGGMIRFDPLNLTNTDLRNADMENATLEGVDLAGADLSGANLCNARLNGANLQGCCLESANLQYAYLSEAHLGGAGLKGARLQGAYLTRATGVTQEQLKTAIMNKSTRLPELGDVFKEKLS